MTAARLAELARGPEGGGGGFFVRGGVQKSTLKKSDNVDDHVFMPGQKVNIAYVESKEEEEDDEADAGTAQDRELRDAQRAQAGDDYQKKMYDAATKFYGTKERMELKMTANKIGQGSGFKPGGGIRANEIKGFLNIWCNQRRLKPEYEFIERGKPPKGTFICKLKIESFDYVAECEARTKREAQADVAWEYALKLVSMGYCSKSDLPNKTMATVNNQGCVPTEWKAVLTDDHLAAAGNWTPDNCRKRLSMFCNFEKISCEILNTSVGPDHAKIAIAELKLTLRKYGKEFYAKEQARTKKLANSLVAWSIMKQLYEADMMEAFGQRLKRACESKFLQAAEGGPEAGYAIGNDIQVDTGMNEDTGDWTLDTSRSRLHEYFAARGIEVEYAMKEIGFPPDRVYQALLAFEIDGFRYRSFHECDNKKMTQKKTAFDVVVQLYHDKKIEANHGRRNWGDGPNGNILGQFMPGAFLPPQMLGPMHGPRDKDEFLVKTKLSQITPNPNFANVVNSTLLMLERFLKEISEEMMATKREDDHWKDKPDEEVRDLMGVMRVGALSANTVLTNESEFMVIMMMREKPTAGMLCEIAARLNEKVPRDADEFCFTIAPNILRGGIEITRECLPYLSILIAITSAKCRNDSLDDAKELLKVRPDTPPVAKPESPAKTDPAKTEVDTGESGEAVKTENNTETKETGAKTEETGAQVSDGDIKTEAEATAEDAETTPADAPVEIPPCYKEMPFTPVDEQVPVVEKEPEKEASTEKETVAEETVKQEKIDDENAENQPKESDKMEVDEKEAGEVAEEEDGEIPDSPKPDSKPGSAKGSRATTPIQDENSMSVVPVEVKEEKKPEKKGLHHLMTNPGMERLIDNNHCLAALAELRRAKWFQQCATQVPSCIPTIRIFRDLSQRIQTWGILTDWQLHLLIQKSLESFQGPMLPSDAVRRVFSAVAGGVLLKGGLGIRDPCEPGEEDAFDNLTEQDLHDLTASAHHALRLICFSYFYKVLGLLPLQ